MRKSIDGLTALVHENFGLNPFEPSLFLFCKKYCDRIKALFREGDILKKDQYYAKYTATLKAMSKETIHTE